MVFVIQVCRGILWYTMVNRETVPWCTVVCYGIMVFVIPEMDETHSLVRGPPYFQSTTGSVVLD